MGSVGAKPEEGSPELHAAAIMEVLNRHNVAYVVIGAFAALAQKAPIPATRDIDLTPEASEENLTRLSDALAELGARIRTEAVPGGLAFKHSGSSLGACGMWNLVCPYGEFDISFHPAGFDLGFQDLAARACLPDSGNHTPQLPRPRQIALRAGQVRPAGPGLRRSCVHAPTFWEDARMEARLVALLRGINVGRSKRVAMAQLRELLARLGYRDVVTYLQSGNAVFTCSTEAAATAAAAIEAALLRDLGVGSTVIVRTAAELVGALAADPLVDLATDLPSIWWASLPRSRTPPKQPALPAATSPPTRSG